jgi:hypothetical protein
VPSGTEPPQMASRKKHTAKGMNCSPSVTPTRQHERAFSTCAIHPPFANRAGARIGGGRSRADPFRGGYTASDLVFVEVFVLKTSGARQAEHTVIRLGFKIAMQRRLLRYLFLNLRVCRRSRHRGEAAHGAIGSSLFF